MVKVLLDTNILIDYLNSLAQAQATPDRFDDKAISLMTWMEEMIRATEATQADTKLFLETFEQLENNSTVAAQAVMLRQTKRIKLPDAIILATAQVHQRLLITRNSKDFAQSVPGVIIPYHV